MEQVLHLPALLLTPRAVLRSISDSQQRGARDFAAFTRENSGRSIAVINKKQQYLLSTPFIHNEIFGGQVQISGVQTAQLAHEIIANKQNITFHLIANADTVDNEEYQEISLRRLAQNH